MTTSNQHSMSDLDIRYAELRQTASQPSSAMSAGAWCESVNDAVDLLGRLFEQLQSERSRADSAELQVRTLSTASDERDDLRQQLDELTDKFALVPDDIVEQLQAVEKERDYFRDRLPDFSKVQQDEFARAERLQEQIEAVQRWFHTKPWEGAIDGSSHGGENRDWTPAERALGYGTYRDPRCLPALLTSNPAMRQET